MKKISYIITFILFAGNLFATETWDILDKSMAAYNQNGGASTNRAWTVFHNSASGSVATQQSGYVNFKKTDAASTARWAWMRPATALADLTPGMPYSIEVKVRLQPVGVADAGSFFESNQIALRLTKGVAAPIYLKYGNGVTGGFVSTTSGGTAHAHTVNTSTWQVYRWVFHPDHLRYDVYIDGLADPIIEDIPAVETGDQNGVYFGAESYHRCNIDVEYVKMGTGAFYGKPKIASVALNAEGQGDDKAGTLAVTVYTILINDSEKLLVSLVDGNDNTVVAAQEARVSQNRATLNLTVPAGLTRGTYFVKAVAPDDKIGDVAITARKAEYKITSSAFEGKNLATFGNSITKDVNSWAYQVHKNLRFGNLYNGAVSAAVWHKQERIVSGQTIRTQNYYDAGFAGMFTSEPAAGNVLENQQRINNCAIVHLQKYFIDLGNKTAPTPDVIIFSYGTNDDAVNRGDVEPALQGDDLSKVDLYKIAGALRWSIDTLKRKFPDAKIYVALPLQSTVSGKNAGNLQKIAIIKAVCDAKSVPYFDCYNESGITVENHATYLRDGLHPNDAGKVVHGAYITRKLEEAADNSTGLPFIFGREAGKGAVSMVHAGGNISVMSAAEESPLTEVAVYGIAGNEVYRKPVSGNKYTFQAPAASGIYLLRVALRDKTSETFKVLIK